MLKILFIKDAKIVQESHVTSVPDDATVFTRYTSVGLGYLELFQSRVIRSVSVRAVFRYSVNRYLT